MAPSIKHTATKRVHGNGFSMLELMVTIAIVTLITALIMVRYSSFDSSVLLNNQAFEIALDLRDTQVRSVSVNASDTGGDVFSSNFGLYFELANPDTYIFFQDRSTHFTGVGRYDAVEAVGDPFELDPRFLIRGMYVNNDVNQTVSNASIVFQRPNFDARFGFSGAAPSNVASLHIIVGSVRNSASTKVVSVYNSGLITVE